MDQSEKYITEAITAFRKYKQGKILENSFFQAKHQVSLEMGQYLKKEDMDRIVISELSMSLAKKIVDEKSESISEKASTELGMPISIFSIELIVLSPGELKSVVEYCINAMPEQAIQKIRNSNQ